MADLLVTVFVVRYSPDALPHVMWVVVIEVLLNALSVSVFCQLDALLQFSPGPAISQPVP